MIRFSRSNDEHSNIDILVKEWASSGESMISSEKIIQIVPVAVPTVAYYQENDRLYEVDVFYLSLTKSGAIKPLVLTYTGYWFAEDGEGFLNIKHKYSEDLKEDLS